MSKTFLWRKISKEEQEEIKKQAKNIMDDFSRELEKVPEKKFEGVQRKEQTRKEKTGKSAEKEFRKRFFENAPKKGGEYIEAEKGEWLKS